jgi:hypothetical protein
MQARVNTPVIFHYFDAAGAGPFGALTAEVFDGTDTLIATIDMGPTTAVPALYLTDTEYLFTTGGNFTVKIEDGVDGILATNTFSVGLDPTPDIEVAIPATLKLSEVIVGDTGSTVTVKIFDSSGSVITEPTTTYDGTLGVYKADTAVTLTTQGSNFLVWIDDGVPVHAEALLTLSPRNKELVKFYVGYITDNTSTAQVGVTVLVSDVGGAPLDSEITNANGEVQFNLFPGDYVVTLIRTPDVFAQNNFPITIADTDTTGFNNLFQLISTHFTPTVTTPTTPDLCLITAEFLTMEGLPLPNIEVFVSQKGGPITAGSSVIFGLKKVFKTDANGVLAFSLIRGIVVEVGVMSSSLRRIVTVPDAPTAELFSLMSAAPDVFDIIVPVVPDAIRRS